MNVGGYDLSFEPIDLGGVGGEGSHDFCGDYYDGKYYLADKNAKKVYVFSIDGTEATLDAEYDTEVGFEKVTVNHDGRVILSQGIYEALELLSDGTFSELLFRHDLECSTLEDFAAITWVNADPTVIHDGVESPWVFENINDDNARVGNLSMVFDCEIVGDRVLIGGNFKEADEEDSYYRIAVYDYDGNEQAISAEEDSIGYSAVYGTDNGVISANVNKLYLHDSDLKPLAVVKDLKAESGFDSSTLSTFWVKDFSDDGEGALYMLVYASKPDETKEALLYKVTGF